MHIGRLGAAAASMVFSACVAAEPPPSPPPSTAALLARLDALEAKVAALEARNRALEGEAARAVPQPPVATAAGAHMEVAASAPPPPPSARAAAPAEAAIHPRGMIQIDHALYHARAGGYDYNDGTDIRRGRFGFDGTIARNWKYRIEAELVKNSANLLDAYVQYVGIENVVLTAGQHKTPYGLEANTSDAINTFAERGMFTNAFGAVGGERRVGLSAAYVAPALTATLGIYGAAEGVQRTAATPDEAFGVNGRVTFDPVRGAGRAIHLGASAFHVSHLANNGVTLGDRPNSRIDGGQIETVAIGPIATGPVGAQTRGVADATYLGGEGAIVLGPLSIQSEYGRLSLDRYDSAATLDFDGYYAFATLFLTGESRGFKGGVVDRVKPVRDFDPAAGGWGALELVARYDNLDLTDRDLSPLAHRAHSWTGGINWYLNPNVRFLMNYVRFSGTNSPLVVAPVSVNGTTAKGDAIISRLQVDF